MPEEATNQILFLDTETTGREKEDRIFQLAFVYDNKSYSGLCKPPVPISIEAMEATHYTNQDVENKPPFSELEEAKILKEILQKQNPIMVAHNALFDIEMLAKEGIVIKRYIDTLRVARHLDPQEKLGAYRLQYLRYALDLSIDTDTVLRAHDALSDVYVLIALFKRLFAKIFNEKKTVHDSLAYMQELSIKPVEIKTLTFGKYKGAKIAEIAQTDPDYLIWLYKQQLQKQNEGIKDDRVEDMLFTLKEHISHLL